MDVEPGFDGAPGFGNMLFERLIGDEEAPGPGPHAALPPPELAALLTRALRAAATLEPHRGGLVVDGLASRLAAPGVVAACLLSAFGLAQGQV